MKPKKPIEALIVTLRGQKVILAADLAEIYGVPTRRLNEQVKRNADRFPEDFYFRLNTEEADAMQCSRSQIATLKRGQNIKYLPFAFTEHGAIMAATVLNSPEAVAMSAGACPEQRRMGGAGLSADARAIGSQRGHPQAARRDRQDFAGT